MLPSVAAKCFYRNLSRHSYDIKYLHSLCFAAPRIFRQGIFHEGKELWRCVHSSAYLLDKPKSKNALQTEKASPASENANKIIKQSVTGDIIVKTETDDSQVVTKVTIEKTKPPDKPADAPEPKPGYCFIILIYFPFWLFISMFIILCNLCYYTS